jgi:hypothetical protein
MSFRSSLLALFRRKNPDADVVKETQAPVEPRTYRYVLQRYDFNPSDKLAGLLRSEFVELSGEAAAGLD